MLPFMRNVPMLTKVAVTTTGFVATEEMQGVGIPVKQLVFAAPGALAPRRATVICAATEELLRTSEGETVLSEELRLGVAAAVDSVFIADLISQNAAISSTGALADIVALLAAVKFAASSSPFFIMSPARRKKAAGLVSTSGFPVFPDIRINDSAEEAGEDESEILSIPVVATDSVSDSVIVLADANQILAAGGTIEIASSTNADVAMATDASSMSADSPPVPVNVVSMFATNSRAIRATRYFSYRVAQHTAVASISGLAW
jgi:hypothetical protein